MRSREPERRGQEVVVGDDATYEPDAKSLSGVDHLAGHQHLRGLLAAHQMGEPAEPGAVAHEPPQHEQLTELRLLRRDPQVGHERKLHSPPDGGAVDGRDDRDVGVQQHVRGRSEARTSLRRADIGGSFATAHHDFHVVARAERGVSPGDHEAPRGRGAHRVLELRVGPERERVARLGSAQRDHAYFALLLVGEVFVHGSPS